MCKRVISVLLALMLVLTLFPVSALAEEPEEAGNQIAGAAENPSQPNVLLGEQGETETPEEEPSGEMDPPELPPEEDPVYYGDPLDFRGIYDICPPFDSSFFGMVDAAFSGSFRGQIDADSQAVYDALLRSQENGPKVDTITVNVSFTITSGDQINDVVNPAMFALWYDHPELYWLYNNSPAGSAQGRVVTLKFEQANINEAEAVFTGSGTAGKSDFDAAVQAAVTYVNTNAASTSVVDRVRAIHDYVCETAVYASGDLSPAIYQSAYSALCGDHNTVCAGYSKAFKVICDQYQIPCVLVSGFGKGETTSPGAPEGYGPHMWNYVQIDGKWYAVDCTWDDQQPSLSRVIYDYYLVGQTTEDVTGAGPHYPFYGQAGTASHIPSGVWSSAGYEFHYPDLSTTSYAEDTQLNNAAITITADSAMAVPVLSKSGGDTHTSTKTNTYTLTAKATVDGSEIENLTWSWKLEGSPAGVTLTPVSGGNTATLTVTNKAAGGSVSVTATCNGTKSQTQAFTITKAAAAAEFVVITSGNTVGQGDTYTCAATVYDQYGNEMTGAAVTWSLEQAVDGVSVSGDKMTVQESVVENTEIKLKASSGSTSDTKTVKVTVKPEHTLDVPPSLTLAYATSLSAKPGAGSTGTGYTYAVTDGADFVDVSADGVVTGKKAGLATVTVTAPGDAEHKTTTKTVSVTVIKRLATVTVKPKTITYGDTLPDFTLADCTVIDLVSGDTLSLTFSYAGGTPADPGTYNLAEPSVTDDRYDIIFEGLTGALKINKKPLALSGGVPAITAVRADDTTNNASQASLESYVTTACGPITVSGVSVPLVWTLNGDFDQKGKTYTLTGKVPSNWDQLNKYSVTGSVSASLEVTKVTVALSLADGQRTASVKASAVEGAAAITDAALKLPANVSYSYTKGDGSEAAGTYAISAWDTELSVLKAAAGRVSAGGADETVTLRPTTLTGVPAWATLGAMPSFALTVTGKSPVTVTVTPPASITYGGTLSDPSATQTALSDGVAADASWSYSYKGVEGTTYGPSANKPSGAGTYEVTATLVSSTHSGSDTKQFTISPKQVTVTWTDPASLVYDNTEKKPAAALTAGDLVGGDTCEITVNIQDGKTPVNAGSYVAEAVLGNANYAVTGPSKTHAYAITQAARNLKITASRDSDTEITDLTLLPGSLTGNFAVKYDNLDNSGTAAYAFASSAISLNKTAGTVTAVGNGVVTITVTVAATTNYTADTKTLTVTAIAKPVTGVTVTSSDPADKFTAVLDGKTVKVSGVGDPDGAVVALTLASVPGLAQTGTSPIQVTYNGTAIPGESYTVDTTGVVQLPDDGSITVTAGTNEGSVEAGVSGITQTDVQTAAAPNLLSSAAKELSAIAQAAKTEGVTAVDVETKLSVTATACDTSAKTLTLVITPQYVITVTKSGEAPVTETKTIPNSAFAAPVTLQFTMPSGIILSASDKVFIEHTPSGGGRMEVLPTTVSGQRVTWQQSSFSTDVFRVENKTVTIIFDNGTTVQTVTYNYADAVNGAAMPDSGTSGGWTYNDRNYTAMTKALFDSMADGATVNFDQPAAPAPVYPSGGNVRPSSSAVAKYPVTVSGGIRNGHVSVSPARAAEGTTVTVTVKPDQGYELDTLRVVDRDGNEVRVRGDGSEYTFSMPRSAVTVSAAFKEAAAPAAHPFRDVDSSHWAAEAITWAYENGYMNGNSATTFNPQGTITRQQLWMILARLSGADPANFAEARAWAVNNGVSDGSNPAANMSRQQMVTFLHRYAEMRGYRLTGSADLTGFPDHASVANYAVEPLSWSVANSIVSGTANGTLNPGGTATRAQFAVILQRFYGSVVEG